MTTDTQISARVDDAQGASEATLREGSGVRRTLLGANYSPWTERARWALDHHGIDYRFREHVPVVGELSLRLRLGGRRRARATVPVFFDGESVIPESLDIVLHADAIGGGTRLVRDRAATERFYERIERALVAMRGRVLARILTDREAQRDSAAVLSARLSGWLRPAVRMSTRFLASKYGVSERSVDECEREMRAMLVEIRSAIDDGTLAFDAFSADHIAAATFVQGVSPVRAQHIRLTPAVRRVWTSEPLAREFADVVAWRDALYAERRRGSAR